MKVDVQSLNTEQLQSEIDRIIAAIDDEVDEIESSIVRGRQHQIWRSLSKQTRTKRRPKQRLESQPLVDVPTKEDSGSDFESENFSDSSDSKPASESDKPKRKKKSQSTSSLESSSSSSSSDDKDDGAPKCRKCERRKLRKLAKKNKRL